MSGVSKDKSFLLTYGDAGKCNVESKARKFLGSFKGPWCKSKATKKEDGKEGSFTTELNVDRVAACGDQPASWETSANWGFSSKMQLSGLTMGSTYSQKKNKWANWCDWGELFPQAPGLHFYSGANFSNGDCADLKCSVGVVKGSKNFGFAVDFTRSFETGERTL